MGPQRLRDTPMACLSFIGPLRGPFNALKVAHGAQAPHAYARKRAIRGIAFPLARGLAFPLTLKSRARGNSLEQKIGIQYANDMQIKATFLAISAESFKNKETGEIINYSRLHIFDRDENKYYKLPIRGEVASRKSEIEFGQEVEIPVEMRTNSKGVDELAVVHWD